jgi:YVTN family beta-propeller protein
MPDTCGPWEVLFNPVSNKLYSATWNSRALIVIDGVSGQITDAVDVHGPYRSMCFDPDGNCLYFGYGHQGVVVVDGETDSVIADFPLRIDADEMCYNRAARQVLCALTDVDSVATIACDSLRRLPGIAVGHYPDTIGVNAVHNRAYVTNHADSTISVIDCRSRQVVSTIPTGTEPTVFDIDTSRNQLYAATSDSQVLVVDLGVNSVVASVPMPDIARSVRCLPAQGEVAVSVWLKRLVFVDSQTWSVVDTVAVACNYTCYDPVTGRMYCTDRARDTLSVVDCRRHRVIAQAPIPTDGSHTSIVYSAAAERCYVADYNNSSILVYRDTAEAVADEPLAKVTRTEPANIVHGWLLLSELRPSHFGYGRAAVLVDAAGRRVLDLRLGPNDVRHLAPGVYFVRERSAVGGQRSADSVRKVIITK